MATALFIKFCARCITFFSCILSFLFLNVFYNITMISVNSSSLTFIFYSFTPILVIFFLFVASYLSYCRSSVCPIPFLPSPQILSAHFPFLYLPLGFLSLHYSLARARSLLILSFCFKIHFFAKLIIILLVPYVIHVTCASRETRVSSSY